MKITVAKTAGFCFGVDRAIQLVYQLADEGKKVCTLGPIIHNPQVVEDLSKKGVRIVSAPEEVKPGETLVIRSHGVSRDVYRRLEQEGIPYEDATCPFVSKIHKIVSDYSEKGYIVLIAGNPSHPEVEGIAGHCKGSVYVFQDEAAFVKLMEEHPEFTEMPAIMVSQTTFQQNLWETCRKTAKKHYTNLLIFDTICNATSMRQREAVDLAAQSDYMVVIGGRNSSNTLKLKEICSQYCNTVLIETDVELDRDAIRRAGSVGVTAGASTPAYIIKEVRNTMSEILKSQDEEVSFEELLEQSLGEKLYAGKRVKGIVTAISPNEIQIDVGAKQSGYIPIDELTDDPTAKVEDLVKKGDELELIVMKVNDQEGTAMLSKRRCDSETGFEEILKAYEEGSILEGVIVDVVRGGVLVLANNVKLFVPASQVSDSRVEDLHTLLKNKVRFKILEVNEGRRRAIGSVRAVLRAEKEAAREEFWKNIEIGQHYTGTVKSLTSYGAFVDLGGVDGMIHITELSWGRIKHPSEVVNVGDTVEVYVKDLDPENKKISLGYKKSEDNPWEILKRDYSVGMVVPVKVVSLTQYGAFAQVMPGIDGLIHISQISTERVNKVSDVLAVGQEVEVKITDIDFDAKRVSLSMRALEEEKQAAAQVEDTSVADIEGVEITSDEE